MSNFRGVFVSSIGIPSCCVAKTCNGCQKHCRPWTGGQETRNTALQPGEPSLQTALSATSIYQLYKSLPLLPSGASQFFPLANASCVGPSVPAFIEMQKATIEASHAALPPKKAGDTRDAITIPSAKGMKEQVNN